MSVDRTPPPPPPVTNSSRLLASVVKEQIEFWTSSTVDIGQANKIAQGIAPVLVCLCTGHPSRPRRRLWRFQAQPWRCPRCRYWWVTVPSAAGYQWVRVYPTGGEG